MGAKDVGFLAACAAVVLLAAIAAAGCTRVAEVGDPIRFDVPVTDKRMHEMAVFGPESEVDNG